MSRQSTPRSSVSSVSSGKSSISLPKTPTRSPAPRSGSTPRSSTNKLASPAKTPVPRRDQGNHSLSMLGAERYQNQLCTTANAEMFNGKKKNPSMYRRPSELGMSKTPMEDKTEIRRNFEVKNIGREHIVKHIPDHDVSYHAAVPDWEEEVDKSSESKSHYQDLHAKRPICQKLEDHMTLGIEGEVEKDSLAKATYQDLHAKRPICAKLLDHNNQIIDTSLAEEEDTEYQSTINKLQGVTLKGERALPAWLGMEKVTPFGTEQDQTRE